MSSPEITVIIVNWNTKDMLANCLLSLTQQNEDLLKIIVIDNNSSDQSKEMVNAKFPDVLLINSGENLGFGKANNIGEDYVEGKYVCFLNPDTIVLDNAISKMKTFMDEHLDVAAIGCKMISAEGEIQPLGLQWYPNPFTELINLLFISSSTIEYWKHYLPYQSPLESGYITKLYGGCLMVRKTVLDVIGWFDERFFMYGEDVDLCRRITTTGYKLYYLSEAEIIHLCGGASGKTTSNFSTLMMCDSTSKLIHKYQGAAGALFYRIAILTGSIVRLAILTIQQSKPFKINSMNKYKTMLKWSINLLRPTIPS